MTAHGVQPAPAQVGLHAGARVAQTGPFQHHVTDGESPIAKREQVYPRDDEVAARQFRQYLLAPEQLGDYRQMLALYERHLPLPAGAAGLMVAYETVVRQY